MKAISFLIILLMFLFTVTAQIYGADWEKIYEDNKREIYLDLSNKQKFPINNYRIWIKWVFKKPNSQYERSVAYYEYNCPEKKAKIIEETDYIRGGSIETYSDIPWHHVLPDTLGEISLNYVCGEKKLDAEDGNQKEQ